MMRSDSRLSETSTILSKKVETEAVIAALEGRSGVTEKLDYRGVPTAVSYAPFEFLGTNWAIIAQQDEAELFAPIKTLQHQMLILILAAFAVLTLCGWLISRGIAKPITGLGKAMINVAGGDTESEVPYRSRGDEIGDMSRSLDKLTYANSGTDKLFQDYAEEFKEAWPSFNPENIIGTCIDTFHKNPSHQRKMLSNPAILPFETDISIGALKFHLSVSGVFDREGEYVGNILQWDNVTAIRTNAGILQAIDRAQAVIEFLPNGQIVKANENFLKTLGYEASDIKGKHHRIFCHPSFAQSPEYKSFWEQLRAGEFITDKFRRVSKSGEDIWIEATYSPLVDSSGKVYKVIKIASDVTAAENARVKYEDDMAKKNASQELVVSELATGLRSLSDGNLTAAINIPFDQEYEGLRGDFNSALDKLTATMQKIMSTAANIQNGAVEMSQASDDLSKRTENQAAALEETAAALDEVTATVQQTAKAAEDARTVVSSASNDAETGGQVVRAGRGFAVVASEVRALAQRSSDAAKDIKDLISASAQHVQTGVSLVDQTGTALDKLVAQVANVDSLVSEIASSANEQATGLAEVNSAVNDMDRVTQKNAAMVEESTAALCLFTNSSSERLSFLRRLRAARPALLTHKRTMTGRTFKHASS